ncbi:hydroxyacid dehydrogenase [Alcaligenaceae bacterium]|nr:hydroxyacid dehydrogenase [Alcaligenaceae bacterium]
MPNKINIYLTHSPQSCMLYYGDQALAKLQALGTIVRNKHDSEPSHEQILNEAGDCDVIVAFRQPSFPATLLEQLPRLVALCRVAVDVSNIDIVAASRNGILVTRATPGFGASVAEWVIGVMIDLSRSISASNAVYHEGREPAVFMGRELRGATLGVIGYGTIGRYLCRLAQAFGMNIIVHDPNVDVDDVRIQQINFHDLLTKSDYVACLAPSLPDTVGLMNDAAFGLMKPSSFFINASRGELVDEPALLHALENGLIAGAALDVGSEDDQKPARQLAMHPLVIATPHIGGLTPEAATHQAMDSVRQLAQLVAGDAPDGALNLGDAWRLNQLRKRLAQPAQEGTHAN